MRHGVERNELTLRECARVDVLVCVEVRMMEIVESDAPISRQQVEWVEPREVESGVHVRRMQCAHGQPSPEHDQMVAHEREGDEEARAQEHALEWMSVLGGHRERSRERVVHLAPTKRAENAAHIDIQ